MFLELVIIMSVFSDFFLQGDKGEAGAPGKYVSNPVLPCVVGSLVYFLTACLLPSSSLFFFLPLYHLMMLPPLLLCLSLPPFISPHEFPGEVCIID